MEISITETAAKHIKNELKKRGHGKGITIGVKKAGCSGMAYTLEFADNIPEHHHEFLDKEVYIFVHPKDYVYLKGVEVDFVTEGLNEGLKFNNPNESTKCGCGESFNI
jgi:iron-sulfur cluster assembly protein